MSIYFLHSRDTKFQASKYFFIFQKTFPEKNIFMISIEDISKIFLNDKDLVLSFDFYGSVDVVNYYGSSKVRCFLPEI